MKNPLSVFPQRLRSRIPGVWKSMVDLESEMNQWLQSPFNSMEEESRFGYAPACNLKENAKEYTLQFDLPGVKRDEIKIEVENNRLTITGEREEKKEEKDSKHFLTECCYGSFMRSLALPMAVDEDKIDAKHEDGVLTIKIPKAESSKAKTVKIH